MAELGALSLRIETTGDKQVLRALDAIDTKAAKTGISLTNTVAALNKLGISARQVGGQIQVADGQLEQATAIVRRLGSQAQVTAGDLQRLGTATAQAAAAPAQSLQVLGRDVVQASGKLTAFGKSGLNAFNALSFGLSQMAATGQTSFRSLATSAASVLAFFGPQGAIASAVIATGLVLIDFWRRQKKEVSEFQELVTGLLAESDRVARELNPFRFATDDLEKVQRALTDFEAKRSARLAKIGTEQEFRAGTALTSAAKAEIFALNAELARLQQAVFQAERRRQDAIRTMSKGLPEVKVEGKSNAKLAEERQRAIEAEIAALGGLQKARGLTSVELLRLIDLEATLTKELAGGNLTKVREAEVWEQITKARQAAASALPAAVVRPITPDRAQPQARIEVPAAVAAQLDPKRIQADVQKADAEMAARVRAFNFQETSQALSQSLSNTLSSAIVTGFAQGLGQGGIGDGFKRMSAQMLSGLGNSAISFALASQQVSIFMSHIAESLASLNPFAALAGGIALAALGARLGGAARSSFGGAGGGGGFVGTQASVAPLSVSRLIVDPNADLRQRAAAGLGRMSAAAAPPSPFAGAEFLVATSPRGQEYIVTKVVDPYQQRRS